MIEDKRQQLVYPGSLSKYRMYISKLQRAVEGFVKILMIFLRFIGKWLHITTPLSMRKSYSFNS